MPEFRPPVTPEELQKRRTSKTTRLDLKPYVAYILTIDHGGAGQVRLSASENKQKIKRHITLAPTMAGKTAKYLRSSENELLFQIGQA